MKVAVNFGGYGFSMEGEEPAVVKELDRFYSAVMIQLTWERNRLDAEKAEPPRGH